MRDREGSVNGNRDVWSRDNIKEDPSAALIIRKAGKEKTPESRTKMRVLNSQGIH